MYMLIMLTFLNSAYQLEIDFTLLVGQLILFLALLAFEAVFDLWIAPKLLQNGWLPVGIHEP